MAPWGAATFMFSSPTCPVARALCAARQGSRRLGCRVVGLVLLRHTRLYTDRRSCSAATRPSHRSSKSRWLASSRVATRGWRPVCVSIHPTRGRRRWSRSRSRRAPSRSCSYLKFNRASRSNTRSPRTSAARCARAKRGSSSARAHGRGLLAALEVFIVTVSCTAVFASSAAARLVMLVSRA